MTLAIDDTTVLISIMIFGSLTTGLLLAEYRKHKATRRAFWVHIAFLCFTMTAVYSYITGDTAFYSTYLIGASMKASVQIIFVFFLNKGE